MNKIGFDNDKYLLLQSEKIRERINTFGGKLYLEFGGKLFDDFHASRVLPGFKPDSKLQMLLKMKDEAEIVIVINAAAIESLKMRGDLGITYDMDVLRLIDAFREVGLYVGSVCLTQFAEQKLAKKFEKTLKKLGIKTYRHYPIADYQYRRNCRRVGAGQKRLHRNVAQACGGHRARTGKRKDGHMYFAALSRQQARNKIRLCQV